MKVILESQSWNQQAFCSITSQKKLSINLCLLSVYLYETMVQLGKRKLWWVKNVYNQVYFEWAVFMLRSSSCKSHHIIKFLLIFSSVGFPKLQSLQILGDPIEGGKLHVEKTYWGGIEGFSKLQWFLVSSVVLFFPLSWLSFLHNLHTWSNVDIIVTLTTTYRWVLMGCNKRSVEQRTIRIHAVLKILMAIFVSLVNLHVLMV